MKTVFLICGETGCGKSTLVEELCQKYGYTKVVSYTTRPCRGESDIDHIFITPEEVEMYKHTMAAYTKIGDYEYFATADQIQNADFYVIDYDGICRLNYDLVPNVRFVTVYINVDKKTRTNRAHARGDDPMVVFHRCQAEIMQFDRLRRTADFDYSISNYDKEKATNVLKKIVDVENGKDVAN